MNDKNINQSYLGIVKHLFTIGAQINSRGGYPFSLKELNRFLKRAAEGKFSEDGMLDTQCLYHDESVSLENEVTTPSKSFFEEDHTNDSTCHKTSNDTLVDLYNVSIATDFLEAYESIADLSNCDLYDLCLTKKQIDLFCSLWKNRFPNMSIDIYFLYREKANPIIVKVNLRDFKAKKMEYAKNPILSLRSAVVVRHNTYDQ